MVAWKDSNLRPIDYEPTILSIKINDLRIILVPKEANTNLYQSNTFRALFLK